MKDSLAIDTIRRFLFYAVNLRLFYALLEYNDNPYDLKLSQVTFAKIYKRWYKDTFDEDTNRSTIRNYETAYKRAAVLHRMKMGSIRPHHMQNVLDTMEGSYTSVKRVHLLFQQLFKWCVDHDAIKKNYADRLKVKQTFEPRPRNAFGTEEINSIWNLADTEAYVPVILILIYCGVRISELLDLKIQDVHLEEQ